MLRLEVLDYAGPTSWRWRLTKADGGGFLADHTVRLDPKCWQFEAFSDLDSFLQWRASPDRRVADEAKLVEQVGRWIGDQVLGPVGAAVAAPVTVTVAVPAGAELLAYQPLELGWVDDQPLALQGVSLVLAPPAGLPRRKQRLGERLRMLAVFSLPVDASALNLRRERYELAQRIHRIAATHNQAIELRVVQYGVTRQRLTEVLQENPGWDVLHISGHGLPGGLLLENDDGRHDLVSSAELVRLLEPTVRQLKLAVLSSCQSAALTAGEHLRLLGITPPETATAAVPSRAAVAGQEAAGPPPLPAVAAALSGRVDCAVVAMRYPVADEFAVNLAEAFYDLVLGKQQPVAAAVGLALPDLIVDPPTPAAPAISVAIPALFGASAASLQLTPPAGPPLVFAAEAEKLAGFPKQPARFVGRVGPMSRATAALAPASGRSGVLLVGMAGAGKSACALELAYTHEQSFARLVWHQAPNEGADIADALTRFALSLEAQLPGLQLVHLVDDAAALRRFLPTLTSFLRQQPVLIVLDNVESLLTDGGDWRDARWAALVDALAGHDGLGRLVLTSRRAPTGLPAGVLVEPVHALSLAEAVLLAREWPHLRTLLDGTHPALAAEEARALAARTLAVVQGHPKLIELADGQARDPARLQARLAEADTRWLSAGTRVEGFFTTGESAASATAYLQVLQTWTRSAAADLPDPSRLLFSLLCCLQPDDRLPPVVADTWAHLWHRLALPGDPPPADQGLPLLEQRTLVAVSRDQDNQPVSYVLHPAIADTGRQATGADLQAAVDAELAAYWLTGLQYGVAREQQGGGGLVLHAARSALPYLLRTQNWDAFGTAAQAVLIRDDSPETVAQLLPVLRHARTATRGSPTAPNMTFLLARALRAPNTILVVGS